MDQVRDVLRLRHHSTRTETACCDWIRRHGRAVLRRRPRILGALAWENPRSMDERKRPEGIVGKAAALPAYFSSSASRPRLRVFSQVSFLMIYGGDAATALPCFNTTLRLISDCRLQITDCVCGGAALSGATLRLISNDKSQMAEEDGGQRTEDRGQRTDVGGQSFGQIADGQ